MNQKKVIKIILPLTVLLIMCLINAAVALEPQGAEKIEVIPYFAYGSNTDSDDLAQWCINNGYDPIAFDSVVPAVLKGYKLAFNHYSKGRNGGAANIMESPDDSVHGLLYLLKVEDMKKIRKKEGYPRTYDEILVEVKTPDGRIINNVLTYKLRKEKVKPEHQPPAKYYLGLIINNAKKYDFSPDYIGYLESIKTKD
ncbi:MAG: gamma-glutamylcyclotransferase [Nitrospiraceae bacterium]|nr:gamma-glutamylcyclotransferase [Nitrospiraceae bacterium]